MRAFAILALTLSSCFACAIPRPFRSTGFVPLERAPLDHGYIHRSGWMRPALRDSMASVWSDSAGQVERAWCVTKWSVMVVNRNETPDGERIRTSIDSQFTVWELQPARTQAADYESVRFVCPSGMPTAHVHPPQTCTESGCRPGGWNAHQCAPSPEDLRVARRREVPFEIVWCGRREWRFYFPHELITAPWPVAKSSP